MGPEIPPSPIAVSPSGDVSPSFAFLARIPAADPADPLVAVRLQVRAAGAGGEDLLWTRRVVPPPEGWPPGEVHVDNPGQPTLPVRVDLEWRLRTRTASGAAGPWMPWQRFRLLRGGPSVMAQPVGVVAQAAGMHLRAQVTLPAEAASVVAHEVQIAPITPGGAVSWSDPAWTSEGGPLAPGAGGPGEPSLEPFTLRFRALGGRAVVKGLVVDTRTPTALVAAGSAVSGYQWRIGQFGHLLRATPDARLLTGGISEDGRCISFRVSHRVATRGGLPLDFFVPPFPPGMRQFRGETYGPGAVAINAKGHRAYAVDFNRGSGTDDRGIPVHPVAPGEVAQIDADDGTVWVEHWPSRTAPRSFRRASQYTHLALAAGLRVGQQVTLDSVLGTIDGTGMAHPDGTPDRDHPHLHHRHLRVRPAFSRNDPAHRRWLPIKMSFGGVPVTCSLAGPRDPTQPLDEWRSDRGASQTGFSGWTVDARAIAKLSVRVRWKETGQLSDWAEIRFAVDRTIPPAQVTPPACGGAVTTVPIDRRYDGPPLAAGRYAVRYRCRDDLGDTSPWAVDRSLVVTG